MIKINDDEIGVKTASKFLAHMTGCWDPEFKPNVEVIWRFSQFAFFGERTLWGDFPIQSSRWQWRSRPGQPAWLLVVPFGSNVSILDEMSVLERSNWVRCSSGW